LIFTDPDCPKTVDFSPILAKIVGQTGYSTKVQFSTLLVVDYFRSNGTKVCYTGTIVVREIVHS